MSKSNKSKKLLSFLSNIQKFLKLLELHSLKEFCFMVLLELERHFQQEQLPIILIVNSFEFQEPSLFKSILEKEQEWSESYSSWPENMPLLSFSWMKLILQEDKDKEESEEILKFSVQCLSYSTSLMDLNNATILKSSWQQIELIFQTQLC